jgi:hypothetical protein
LGIAGSFRVCPGGLLGATNSPRRADLPLRRNAFAVRVGDDAGVVLLDHPHAGPDLTPDLCQRDAPVDTERHVARAQVTRTCTGRPVGPPVRRTSAAYRAAGAYASSSDGACGSVHGSSLALAVLAAGLRPSPLRSRPPLGPRRSRPRGLIRGGRAPPRGAAGPGCPADAVRRACAAPCARDPCATPTPLRVRWLWGTTSRLAHC